MAHLATGKEARNVEIKAIIKNWEEMVAKVKQISRSEGQQIKQRDVFFKVKEGRLKMRKFEDNSGELIFYNRPDVSGPSMSKYRKCDIDAKLVDPLVDTLTQALGVTGTVTKIRRLYTVDQTRIHLDDVDGLGIFMELEVVLRPDQTFDYGNEVARTLMKQLDISEEDLLDHAYTDMLHDQRKRTPSVTNKPDL